MVENVRGIVLFLQHLQSLEMRSVNDLEILITVCKIDVA